MYIFNNPISYRKKKPNKNSNQRHKIKKQRTSGRDKKIIFNSFANKKVNNVISNKIYLKKDDYETKMPAIHLSEDVTISKNKSKEKEKIFDNANDNNKSNTIKSKKKKICFNKTKIFTFKSK